MANDLTSDFWRIYEMGFPEGTNMKAARGSSVSLGGLFDLNCL